MTTEQVTLTDQYPENYAEKMDRFLSENNIESLIETVNGANIPLRAIFDMGYQDGFHHGRQSAVNDLSQALKRIGNPGQKWIVYDNKSI